MSLPADGSQHVLALCGGVGGAKLALGLSRVLPASDLTIAVNTGDDFEHFGLTICPDLDTVSYTLSGLNNPDLGWGRRDESWAAMDVLSALGAVSDDVLGNEAVGEVVGVGEGVAARAFDFVAFNANGFELNIGVFTEPDFVKQVAGFLL